MGSNAKQTLKWGTWFGSEDADRAKGRLLEIRPYNVPAVSADTILELAMIKKSGKQKLSETEVREYLGSLSMEDLQGHVSIQARLLDGAESAWDQKRTMGWRKARTNVQNFTLTFDRFLKAFSGIVEIAKMADEHYGGAATKILSVFYATIKIKAENDEAILSAMETITDRLPEAQIYGQLYADSDLASMLADAYTNVIVFAREATMYFQDRSIKRALKSIRDPAKFIDIVERLVKNFTNIRVRCEALLSCRVTQLATQNIELLRQIRVLTEGQYADRVRRLQKTLDRRQSDSKKTRDDDPFESRQFLSMMTLQTPRGLSQMTLRDLQRVPKYHTWATISGSSILFLHGCNHKSQMAPQSWLSCAVVDLISHLQGHTGTENLVAYHLCSGEQTIEMVMKNLISQLLDLQPAVLSDADDMQEIELRISRNQLDDYARVLRLIVDKCQGPVHLVISRPETCDRKNLWALMKNLLALVTDAANTLKVLLVVRTEFWSIEERLVDVDGAVMDSGRLLVSRHDQRLCLA